MVSITCSTPDSIIRYTLDGNDPTETSTLYEREFDVTPPITVKARGFKEGMLASDVASYEVEPVPVTVPMALPDGSVLFYDRGMGYGEYHIGDDGYPVRDDGAVDDGSAKSKNWRYLICDKEDLNGVKHWGTSTNEGLTGTTDVGNGLPNTDEMISKYIDKSYSNTYWWQFIKNKRDSTGFNWFMPSHDELVDILYRNKDVISSEGGTIPSSGWYWSSSEYDTNKAYIMSFSAGDAYKTTDKSVSQHCRLLRRI